MFGLLLFRVKILYFPNVFISIDEIYIASTSVSSYRLFELLKLSVLLAYVLNININININTEISSKLLQLRTLLRCQHGKVDDFEM